MYNRLVLLLAALSAILLTAPPAGSQNLCGDINWDGSRNVADLTALVDYLFRGTPPDPYFRPADVNGVRGVNVADITYYVSYLFRGGPVPDCDFPFGVDTTIGCFEYVLPKDGRSFSNRRQATDSVEYMLVELIGNDLRVYHMNAVADCCPGIIAEVELLGSNIYITERDTLYGCPCLCLFNLMTEVSDLQPGTYMIRLYGISDPWHPQVHLVGTQEVTIGGP